MKTAAPLTKKTSKKVAKKSDVKKPTLYIHTKDLSSSDKDKILFPLLEGLYTIDADITDDFSKADAVIFITQDKKLLKKAYKEGIVPITEIFSKEVMNYNPISEKGNSFVFESMSPWEIFAAVIRLSETYKFPYDWKYVKISCKNTKV